VNWSRLIEECNRTLHLLLPRINMIRSFLFSGLRNLLSLLRGVTDSHDASTCTGQQNHKGITDVTQGHLHALRNTSIMHTLIITRRNTAQFGKAWFKLQHIRIWFILKAVEYLGSLITFFYVQLDIVRQLIILTNYLASLWMQPIIEESWNEPIDIFNAIIAVRSYFHEMLCSNNNATGNGS
jgi:hypothetical protein